MQYDQKIALKAGGWWAGFAAIIVFGALCFRLGYLPLLQPDEGRNAEVAREMKVSGDWISPTYNGVTYLDKPAFYFKAVALSLACFGDSETAARIPSVLFGLAMLGAVFVFCRRVYGTRVAWLAVIVVASTPLYLANSRIVIFDIALACFTSGALLCGFLAEREENTTQHSRWWYVLGSALTGFATLVKGPVGFLIPVLVLVVFNLVQKRKGFLKRLFAPLNFVVFFGVTLPWFISLCRAHPDFLYYGLVEESFHRFTTPKFHRHEPFYFYFLIVAATFFPWSLMLPEAVWRTWKRRWAATPADKFCVAWASVVVIFFSFSQSKLPGYILSATVPCGILVARLFEAAWANPTGKAAQFLKRGTAFFGTFCLLLVVAVLVAWWSGITKPEALTRPLRLPLADATRLVQSALPMVLLVAAAGALALVARFRSNLRYAFVCLALFPVLLIHAGTKPLDVVFNAKSARQLTRQLPALSPGTQLAFFHCYPCGLPFYLGRTATLVTDDGAELTSNYVLYNLKSGQPWAQTLVPGANFDQWLAARKSAVYLLAEKRRRDRLDQLAVELGITVQELNAQYVGVLLPALAAADVTASSAH
ncbi:MAG: glycosyltransferase family 39 protein [Verrucomicrobia bacterium]|nr:MAG: glycosyltransferase family 39 protein [Verrucomicrobiota bacterium]